MSKGPGKWQRAILEALETKDRVILRDLLPMDYTHADLSALYRAADSLRLAGRVWVCRGYRQYTDVEPIGNRPPQVFFGDKK